MAGTGKRKDNTENMGRYCRFCGWYNREKEHCKQTYEKVKPHRKACEEYEAGLICPDCEVRPRLHSERYHAWYWYYCPRCRRRTDEYQSEYSAAAAWEAGNTYIPEEEGAGWDEDGREPKVIRRW